MPDRTTRSGPGATTSFSTFTYRWDTFADEVCAMIKMAFIQQYLRYDIQLEF